MFVWLCVHVVFRGQRPAFAVVPEVPIGSLISLVFVKSTGLADQAFACLRLPRFYKLVSSHLAFEHSGDQTQVLELAEQALC